MDYPSASSGQAPATRLCKYQWDLIHDPQKVWFKWLEKEEEGASVMTDISTINTWKEIFPKMTDSELIRISRIYDTVAVQFDSLNINSITNNIYLKGDLKDWSVRKSSHTGKLKQVAINIATKDKADYNGIDSKEIYVEKYTYEIKLDTTKWTHTTNVALHSYVNALNFTKPKITSFEKLREITTIKIATFKLKSNKREEPTLLSPLDNNGVPSTDFKFKLPLYRIDDYVIIAFYSSSGNNPDIVFQLIPEGESTKNMEVASWLKHLDILNDTANAIVLNTVQLSQIFPNADTTRIREVVTAINKYSSEFNINTIERMSHFLGQIGTETTDVGNGKPLSALVESCNYNEERIKEVFGKRVKEEEITIKDKTYKPLLNPELFDGFDSSLNYYFEISNKKIKTDTIYCLQVDGTFKKYPYSGQRIKKEYLNGANNCALFNYVYCCNKSGLGNGDVSTGDGALFRGRGFIHLTGRSNYETKFYKYWKMEYPDDKRKLEELVTLLETDVDLAIKVSMIYWKYNGINQYIKSTYIDSNNDEIRQVSILVNGGDMDKKKEKIEGYKIRETNTINAYKVLSKK